VNLGNVLSIGSNGLTGATAGTNVASQNITNAATPGYTRRAPNLEAIPLDQGGGVRSKAATRVQDAYLERRNLGARAQSGEADARVKTLSVLDTTFNTGQGSVGESLDAFEGALSDFAATPNNTAVRQVVLSRADDLTQAFHRAADALTGARVDANARITDDVTMVNGKLQQIGSLTGQIVAAKNVGKDAGDLEDKRDQLIRDVSTAVPVNVVTTDRGAITLMMAGSRTLVDEDGGVHLLNAQTDATNGDVRIYRQTAGAPEDITGLITTGSIGGTIAARDGGLADARNALDQLAADTSAAYNTQHAAGVGLDGNTGRNLFTPTAAVSGAAQALTVSSDVLGHPDFLAGAQDPTSLPGDNRNAQRLVGLQDQKVASGGKLTAQQAFSSMVASGGTASRSAIDQASHASTTLTQIEALREAASGVSTDEEMISMMKFQRAYQASLRVIETADSMMSTLLNMNFGR
jgi:flagellar hook-associated protein 1 FlgK